MQLPMRQFTVLRHPCRMSHQATSQFDSGHMASATCLKACCYIRSAEELPAWRWEGDEEDGGGMDWEIVLVGGCWSDAVWCDINVVVPYSAMQRSSVQCSAAQRSAVRSAGQLSSMQRSAAQSNSVQ